MKRPRWKLCLAASVVIYTMAFLAAGIVTVVSKVTGIPVWAWVRGGIAVIVVLLLAWLVNWSVKYLLDGAWE